MLFQDRYRVSRETREPSGDPSESASTPRGPRAAPFIAVADIVAGTGGQPSGRGL